MKTVSEKVKVLKEKIIANDVMSAFVKKVELASKNGQAFDDQPYWQANNDKPAPKQIWGK